MDLTRRNGVERESTKDGFIVVTGAGGFIGGHLVKYFYE